MELPRQVLRAGSAPSNLAEGRWRPSSGRENEHPQRRGNLCRDSSLAGSTEMQPSLVLTSTVRTPGYTLTRTPSTIKMDINSAVFFGDSPEEVQTSQSQDLRAAPMEDSASLTAMYAAMLEESTRTQKALKAETAELNIKLEDQNRLFEETKKRMEEYKKEKEQLIKQHEMEKENMERKSHEELQSARGIHCDELRVVEEAMEHKIADYKKQLILVNETLEQKVAESEKALQILSAESDKALQTQLQEWKTSHDQEMKQLEEELREQMAMEADQLREKLTNKHRQEVDELNLELEQQVKVMMTKINEAVKLKEDLHKACKRIKKLEREISRQKEKIQGSSSKQATTEAKLAEAETKIKEFEMKLDDKVKQVEANFRGRLDDLLVENTDLRHRLLNNTENFSRYKSNIERLQAQKITSLIEKVQILVRARKQADLSVAIGSRSQSNPTSRPNSAPITKSEIKQAGQQTASNRPHHS